MNRFVYLVHCEYEDPSGPVAALARVRSRRKSQDLTRIPAAMARYLPDLHARVWGEPHQGDPNVIRMVVTTTLDETVIDAAFVRFIRGCDGRDCGEDDGPAAAVEP